jgi:hypothetical protein
MHRSLLTFVSVVCLLAGLAPARLDAQTADTVGVRARGMGGAFTAVADDSTATWWNPAGIAAGPYLNMTIEVTRGREPNTQAGDVPDGFEPPRSAGISVAYPGLGLSYYRLQISEIAPLTSTADSAAGRQDGGVAVLRLRTVSLNQFGATVGQSIGRHLVVASTVKVINAVDETHGGLDIGALAKVGRTSFGLMVRNVTEPSFGSGPERIVLDATVRAGIAVGLDRLTVAGDLDMVKNTGPRGDERRWAVGAEARTTSQVIEIRGGLSGDTVGDSGTSLSGGVSVAVRRGIYLDGVLVGGSDDLRRSWGIALRLTF